jgi:hypothetical protein
MSDVLKRYLDAKKSNEPAAERPEWERGLNEQEQDALARLQKEAKEAGASLANDGKGGLPPSLVLHVMRRDEFRCKNCGKQEGLIVHHKGGIVRSKKLSDMGHKNIPQNIDTVCEDCEDRQHDKAREDGVDSSQVEPEGDK